ncbi:DUF3909 domain-containing protein [Bacillus cereus]|uniref:DUF3909 family protein n=1 Tax=Bacillus nitratireducens TaxID=2026193 RepID=A0ABU6PAJ3_9BACI|nr:DUF3909 family protein [Bacillus nitratireducens]EJS59453.1 hypothetical protein ICG_01493 [Bacillus cereus BAG1X1-3]EOO72397.1 hypothetical protein IC7_03358 [Bacillus cereus BAG1O-1]OSY00185.1 hypothetical protein BTJ45_02791 [Bacillus mycoides]PDY24965.1 DUF3909 domain-containing protein [Bacillus cereus]MDR4169399.1 DUF3909 domain-containing protein [Bacillus nitratireducens]
MDLQKFDEMIDAVQQSTCVQINDKQKEAFKQKYDFEPSFEYGRDEKGHYVIRTSKKMLEEMEFYLALKYDRDGIALYMHAEIGGTCHVSVSYSEEALHLQELFQFLEENK